MQAGMNGNTESVRRLLRQFFGWTIRIRHTKASHIPDFSETMPVVKHRDAPMDGAATGSLRWSSASNGTFAACITAQGHPQ